MVAIFPLPHPCAIRFPKSNRQTHTSPISSALQWSLFSFISVYIIFLLCLPLCLSVVSPGEAFATADRPARSEQWSFGGEQFQAPPRWDTTGAIDFPSQIVKPPRVLSNLLCSGRYSAFSHFISFSCCVSRCASPLCLSVVSPRGGVCNCWPSSPFWAVKLWGRAVPSASPVRHNWCHIFPKSNRQISTNPISSAFSGRYFFPGRAHVPLDFPGQIPTSPISSALQWRYSCFSQFTSFSCCVSRCASPLCLPREAFATADRPARSEQWSFGGEQFQAPGETQRVP